MSTHSSISPPPPSHIVYIWKSRLKLRFFVDYGFKGMSAQNMVKHKKRLFFYEETTGKHGDFRPPRSKEPKNKQGKNRGWPDVWKQIMKVVLTCISGKFSGILGATHSQVVISNFFQIFFFFIKWNEKDEGRKGIKKKNKIISKTSQCGQKKAKLSTTFARFFMPSIARFSFEFQVFWWRYF